MKKAYTFIEDQDVTAAENKSIAWTWEQVLNLCVKDVGKKVEMIVNQILKKWIVVTEF
jgi:hypothetical protein